MPMFRNAFASLATTLALGAVTFTVVMPAQAHAHTAPAGVVVSEDGVPSMEVRYADLDLNTASGRAALANRIDRAATSVCRAVSTQPDPFHTRLEFDECRKEALKSGQMRMALLLTGPKAG